MDWIFKLVGIGIGLLAASTTFYVIANWPEVSDKISSWLHDNKLNKTALMSALVIFDKVVVGIRHLIIVETKQTGRQTVEEKTLSIEEIRRRDPDVYNELQKRDHLEIDILKQL